MSESQSTPTDTIPPVTFFPTTENLQQQYKVWDKLSHRVLHTTNQGLTTEEAQADAQIELEKCVAMSPERDFEIVEAFAS